MLIRVTPPPTRPNCASYELVWTVNPSVLLMEGTKATPKVLNDFLTGKKAGDRIQLRISRNNSTQDLAVVLGANQKRIFTIRPAAHPGALEAAILKDWLREAQ